MKRSAIERLNEERAKLVVDSVEDLVREVVEDEALAAAEGVDEGGGIGSIAQRDRRQLEAGDPALGALEEASDERWVEGHIDIGEICPCFRRRVPQVIGAQLEELAVGPQAGERERRVLAGQEDRVDERWSALDQEADEAMDRFGVDGVVVVEHEDEGVVAGRHRRRAAWRPGGRGSGQSPGQTGWLLAAAPPGRTDRALPRGTGRSRTRSLSAGSSDSQAHAKRRDSSQPATATVLP